HYTLEQAKTYLDAYDLAVETPQQQVQRKVKRAGRDVAYSGGDYPDIQDLLKRYARTSAAIS
ncbi:MAG TPA: hypothetical protein PLD88_05795, partial [Candidatus Berkiella sp.]|nr:hypothetical protein [Candidatus Berkiella sp.]